jgi:hypothetical protein
MRKMNYKNSSLSKISGKLTTKMERVRMVRIVNLSHHLYLGR